MNDEIKQHKILHIIPPFLLHYLQWYNINVYNILANAYLLFNSIWLCCCEGFYDKMIILLFLWQWNVQINYADLLPMLEEHERVFPRKRDLLSCLFFLLKNNDSTMTLVQVVLK